MRHGGPPTPALTADPNQQLDRPDGSMPHVMYLQLDNCCKDNKNRFTMSAAVNLVYLGIVEETFVGTLLVGHTHEDIDQMFTIIARYISPRDLPTYDIWKEAVRQVGVQFGSLLRSFAQSR